MVAAADSRAVLCHLNLARGFRGGERQTELLVRALAGTVAHQRVIFRAGQPLGSRLDGVPGVETRAVGGKAGAVSATGGAALIHAHETAGAQAALLRHWLSSTPYVITRRVDNVPKSDPFTRAMYRRAARTIALSRAIERTLRSYDASIVTCRIPSACSGLPFDRAAAERLRAEYSHKFLVGHVAAIDFAHKGQLSLLEAAARLEHTHPELHFVLVGAGGDEQRARRLAERLSNVSFTGWVANVGDYLAAFDMFVLPSEREGLGSILLDAMQFGLPIVATAVGGIPDVITDGVNGLLVPAGDAGALAAAITALAADPTRRAAMTEANREAAGGYHPSLMAARYVEIYRELNPALIRAQGVNA